MELIVINENKLKILLDACEMQKYGLDENEFHLCISDTRKILSKILHNSPLKSNFEMYSPNEKILLQLYPEKHGGCELYVTKLNIENEKITEEDELMTADKNNLLPIEAKYLQKDKKLLLCYRFGELSYVILSCRALFDIGFSGESTLHYHRDGAYYLLLKQEATEIYRRCSAILSEFGELKNAEHTMLELTEYGECICKANAIEIFSKL